MEQLLREWDGENVVIRRDRPSGVWMFIAIHDRTLGMAVGGCRLKIYPEPREALRDAMRLARGMTLKWAAIEFPFGGGKAVLAPPGPLEGEAREEVLMRFGALIESLGGSYGTAEDLGTRPADMDVIGRVTSRVYGRSPARGGAGDPGPYTALGVFGGIRAACDFIFDSPEQEGRTVLVQGLGGVGDPLARRLAEAGARVLVSDAIPDRAAHLARELDAVVVPPEQTYDTPCDVFAPCAIGGILNVRSIPRLQCRIVAGSANNQLEEEVDAGRLHERGILYVPDFVVNAGGAIAIGAREMLGWSADRAEARVLEIGETLAVILADAARRGVTPLREANDRADRVLRRARERGRGDVYRQPARVRAAADGEFVPQP